MYNCASVNLIKQSVSQRDHETVPEIESLLKKGLYLENEKAIIQSHSSIPELMGYNGIMKSMTIELVDNLGGVEAVERRNFLKIAAEREFLEKTKMEDLAKNQELGLEDALPNLSQILAKLRYFHIGSRLTNVKMNVIYNPPRSYVDKKTGKTTVVDPSWSVKVLAAIEFSVWQPDGKKSFSKTLVNQYNKSFSSKPSESVIHLLLPKAISYSFEEIKPELQAIFPMKSYVIATRGDKKYAMVLGGSENKIRRGRVFDLVEENLDPEAQKTTIKIFQVNREESWGEVDGNGSKVKIGSKVYLKPQPLTIFDKAWMLIESQLGL